MLETAYPAPCLDRARFLEALNVFLDHAMPACDRIEYRLVGTGAALLHGVSLPAADIDILVRERSSLDAFGAALSSFMCLEAPAWLTGSRQYYGNYEVNGVEVGISTVEVARDTDTRETLGRGPWERFTFLPCGRHSVPTVALELRLITELVRNRPDRYRPLIEHLQRQGCDIEFVRRGLVEAGLPQAMRDEVLGRLGEHPSGAQSGKSMAARRPG